MECGTSICKKEAIFRVFWPGQTMNFCSPCKERAMHIGEAMGFNVEFEFLDQAAYDSVSVTGSGRQVEDK